MKFFSLQTVTFSVLFLLAGCAVSEPVEPATEQQPAQLQDLSSLPVTIQVTEELATRIEQGLADDFLRENGILEMRRVFPNAGVYEKRVRREGMHRFYYVTWDPERTVTKTSTQLSEVPGVLHVTPQFPIQLRSFNDPYFSSQWHFVNTRYTNADINVQRVWDEFTVGNSQVIVSVVDEGVYMEHEDLADNLIPCYPDGSGSFNFNNNTPTVVPFEGHGTHVAGIIAAVSNNGKGVAGLAGGDAAAGIAGVKVMSCQIMDTYGNTPDYYAAITHGADHGAVILQCSWGFSPDLNHDGYVTDEEKTLYRSYTIDDLPEFKAAIDYFIKYAGCDNDGNQLPDSPMKGGVAFFAAGNDNYDYDPLVSYDAVIAVGAYGATGSKASYSNWGEWLDIAAPGGDAKQGIYSTVLNNAYAGPNRQGTSQACPHVSGVAALLVSYFGGPGFTAEECRNRILRGAVANFSSGDRYIGKKLDAYGAFTVDLDAPVQKPQISLDSPLPKDLTHNQVEHRTVLASDPAGQQVWVSLDCDIPGISLPEKNELQIDATRMAPGEYTLALMAINEDRGFTRFTHTFNVLDDQAPVFSEQKPEGVLVEGNATSLPLTSWFRDPDGDPLRFTASIAHPELAELTVSEDGNLEIVPRSQGVTTLTVKASDGSASCETSMPLIIRDTNTPVFLYPSSASRNIYVVIDAPEHQDVAIAIYSTSGAKVKEYRLSTDQLHPLSLSISDLAPGYYNMQLSYGGKTRTLGFTKI